MSSEDTEPCNRFFFSLIGKRKFYHSPFQDIFLRLTTITVQEEKNGQ